VSNLVTVKASIIMHKAQGTIKHCNQSSHSQVKMKFVYFYLTNKCNIPSLPITEFCDKTVADFSSTAATRVQNLPSPPIKIPDFPVTFLIPRLPPTVYISEHPESYLCWYRRNVTTIHTNIARYEAVSCSFHRRRSRQRRRIKVYLT